MLRKVEVEVAGQPGKQVGKFHHFATDQEGNSWAVVELDDGTVHYVISTNVRFLHPEGKIEVFGIENRKRVHLCFAEFLCFGKMVDYDLHQPEAVSCVFYKTGDGKVECVWPEFVAFGVAEMQVAQDKFDRLVSYLKDLAEMPAPTDDEEFCPGENGNADDDFSDGALDGKVEVARAVLDLLSVEYKKRG